MKTWERYGLYTAAAVVLAGLSYGLWVWPRSAVPPVGEMRIASDTDGRDIAYYASGPERGRRVVLLASLGRSVGDYNDLVGRLSEAGYRTIAVEAPGVGRSPALAEAPETLYDLADLVDAAVVDAGTLETDRLIVIGHAFGNRLARAYASDRPDRVDRIVLAAAGGAQDLRKTPKVLEGLKKSFVWWLPPPVRRAHIEFAFFADGNRAPAAWIAGWHGAAARYQSAAVQATPEEQWRTGGDRPILILQAAEDRVAPAATTSAVIARSGRDLVTVRRIEGAGHALLPERPDEVAAAILEYLAADLSQPVGQSGSNPRQ